MTEVIQLIGQLDTLRLELGKLSGQLADVQRALEPVQKDYDDHIEAYIAGMWAAHVDGELKKLPAADIRQTLALRGMDPALRGRHSQLVASRERLRKRISDLRLEVEALRSVLSAEKELAR